MEFNFFSCVMLCVVISLVSTQEAKEYILTTKNGGQVSAQTVSIKSQLFQSFGASVHKEITIGNLRFLVTTTTPENSLKIKSMQGILNVEPNVKIKASLPRWPPDENANINTPETNDTFMGLNNNEAATDKNELYNEFNTTDGVTAEDITASTVPQGTTEPPYFCYEQNSGTQLWGLTRVVRRGDPWNPDENR